MNQSDEKTYWFDSNGTLIKSISIEETTGMYPNYVSNNLLICSGDEYLSIDTPTTSVKNNILGIEEETKNGIFYINSETLITYDLGEP